MKLLLTGLITVSLLAGCSSSAKPSKPSPTTDKAGYLSAVRPLFPSTNTDADLMRGGRANCAALDAGSTYDVLVEKLAEIVDQKIAAAEARASVKYLCPKYTPELPGN